MGFQIWHLLRRLANDDVITDYLQSGFDLNMNLLCYQINGSIKFTFKVETNIKVYSYNLAVKRKTHENLKNFKYIKMQYMQKKNYNGRDAIKNTKYDVFNIIPTCRPLELSEQKTFIYAEITIMKTLLKLKYKSFVQIYLSFEL